MEDQAKTKLTTKEDLQRLVQKFSFIFEASNEGYWEMDKSGLHHFYTEKFYKDFAIDLKACYLEDWIKIVHPDDRVKFNDNVDTHIGETIKGFKSVYRLFKRDGTMVWIEDFGIAKYDENNEFEFMIGSHRDITDRKAYEEKIINLAYYDEITKLYNRYKFDEVFESCIMDNKYGSLMLFSLINFKHVNEAYGMVLGDQVLKYIAKALKDIFKEGIIARYTGDEFAVYLPQLNKTLVEDLCSSFIQTLSSHLTIATLDFSLDASVGIVEVKNPNQEIGVIVQNARLALKKSRLVDKRICHYNDDVRTEQLRQILLETYIKRSVELEELFVEFQPIISLKSKSIKAFEALVRWRHPELGMIYPDKFIPIAESNQSIIDIGWFVLKKACEFLVSLDTSGQTDLDVTVNLSSIQVMQANFVDGVMKIILHYGIDAKRIIFEITESVTLDFDDIVFKNIHALKQLGFVFALDDYGTGYSSMNNLINIPFDIVKVDKKITWKLVDSETIYELMTAVVTFCKKLDKKLVFEGIENRQMQDLIIAMGGHYVQGFYYGKPMSNEKALTFAACYQKPCETKK